jgi:hypothetical protein
MQQHGDMNVKLHKLSMKININMNSTHKMSFNKDSCIIVITLPNQFHFQSHLKPERLNDIQLLRTK